MKNQFVTYEIALKLKELGFDEPCLATYSYNTQLYDKGKFRIEITPQPFYYPDVNPLPRFILAPLWQQVIDWFREKHKINIFFDCEMNISSMEVDWFKYRYKIYIDRIWSNKGCYNGSEIYEEAREQAILKCIELCQK